MTSPNSTFPVIGLNDIPGFNVRDINSDKSFETRTYIAGSGARLNFFEYVLQL
jgi:hypothetical protein